MTHKVIPRMNHEDNEEEEEIARAAAADPDAPLLTPEELKEFKRVPKE